MTEPWEEIEVEREFVQNWSEDEEKWMNLILIFGRKMNIQRK